MSDIFAKQQLKYAFYLCVNAQNYSVRKPDRVSMSESQDP